mgnify:FL=1|jgi:hypothetical protein
MRKKILQLLMPKANVGNLKKNRETFDKLIKTTDTYVTKAGSVDPSLKEALRKAGSKSLQKTDKILRTRKKDGGRMGLKKGTGLMKKKSNVQKIKETFGPKNKSTKFGMLSVKAGIDKNPNPTQADRIAGAKMKSKKRFV